MKRLLGQSGALLFAACLAPPCLADGGPYQDLLRRLPDTTNIVVAADVQGLRKALGVAPSTALLASDISSLPVAASKFVMGAEVDLSQRTHMWSIGLAQLTAKMSIQDIAKAENEGVDQVVGYSVVPSVRNGYFIELGPDLLGVGTPADRQQLKRWLTYQKSNRLAALSPYLLRAVNPPDPALMIMAVDLDDSLDPSAVHRGLNNSQVMASRRNVNYQGVANTLVKAKGVTLTVQPGNPLNGNLTVDFDTTTEVIQPFAKSLLLEILQQAGVYVTDFDEWQPQIMDRSIGISGTLSLNALRKFGTLIHTPAPPPEAANIQTYLSQDPTHRAVAASQRYFKSATQILNDLKADKTRSVKGLASWYDKYADQMDKLNILDVDPLLVSWASETSEHLRAMGASLQGISLQSGYLQRQKAIGQVYSAPQYTGNYGGYNCYGGYWGGGGANLANNMALNRSGTAGGVTTVDNFEQIRQQQDLLVSQGAAARVQLWQRIDDETADVRRRLTLKYKVEF